MGLKSDICAAIYACSFICFTILFKYKLYSFQNKLLIVNMLSKEVEDGHDCCKKCVLKSLQDETGLTHIKNRFRKVENTVKVMTPESCDGKKTIVTIIGIVFGFGLAMSTCHYFPSLPRDIKQRGTIGV